MSDNPFSKQAAELIEDTLDLIKQVLLKHSNAILEEIHDQIIKRNQRISALEQELSTLRASGQNARRYQRWKELLLEDEAPYFFAGKYVYLEQEYNSADQAIDAALDKGDGHG